MKKAVVLLSGGLDSAVTFYIAKKDYECHALVFDYGQRSACEITFAERIASAASSACQVLKISLPWKGSVLLDKTADVPSGAISASGEIPSTYVPARNLIFMSFAVSFAEAIGAEAVFIGAHQLDFSNYPDCREDFFESFKETVRTGTKSGAEGHAVRVITPVLDMTKNEIIRTGIELGVPFQYTWSCYEGGKFPCGKCESCLLRAKGFADAGKIDPFENTGE